MSRSRATFQPSLDTARAYFGSSPRGSRVLAAVIASGAVLLALSSAQKLGIAGIALAFIAFALASSFLLPRSNPDFPGRGLRLFVGATVLFFVAMMSAVVFLAREDEEAHAEGAATHVDDSEAERGEGPPATPGFDDEDAPGTTTATGGGAGGNEEEGAQGDADAGKAVYASAGCGGCHTFEPAGSTGTVGPNLDEADVALDEAREQVANGGNGMPAFKDQLSEKQIADVAAFVARDGS